LKKLNKLVFFHIFGTIPLAEISEYGRMKVLMERSFLTKDAKNKKNEEPIGS